MLLLRISLLRETFKAFFFLIFSGISVVVLPVCLWAEPEVVIRYDYYNVEGRNFSEIKKEMQKYGAKWEDGKIYDAYTGWHVDWEVDLWTDTDKGVCRVKSVKTRVSITYFLPNWVDYDRASPELRVRWDRFITALRNHEEGHKEIAIQAGRRIEKEFIHYSSSESCEKLKVIIGQVGKEITKVYDRKQKEYDRKTRHGIKQGAIFPG